MQKKHPTPPHILLTPIHLAYPVEAHPLEQEKKKPRLIYWSINHGFIFYLQCNLEVSRLKSQMCFSGFHLLLFLGLVTALSA